MRELRDRGIYTLPNGMVFLARSLGDGYYFLRSPLMDGHPTAQYAVEASGQIVMLKSVPISWRIEDLVDSGRTMQLEETAAADAL